LLAALNSQISPNPSLPKRGNKRGALPKRGRERGLCQRRAEALKSRSAANFWAYNVK